MALITPASWAKIAIFLEKYGISELEAVMPLAAGSVNSNFEIRARGGRRYFLRIYEEQGFEGAARDAETVAELALAGVPTPPPLPRVVSAVPPLPKLASRETHNERSFISELEKKPAALFPWRDGEIVCQARVTSSHASAVGRALAAMHVAGAGAASHYDAGRFRVEDLRERIVLIERAGDAAIAALAPRLKGKLEACSARPTNLPRGLVHGDLFRDNVLFSNENPPTLLALLDFESAFEGALVFDLMVTLLAWCVGDALDLDLGRALVRGYESLRPLSVEEQKNAYFEACFACVRFWITRVTDYTMRLGVGNGRDPGRFEMRLRQLEALGAEDFRAQIFEKSAR